MAIKAYRRAFATRHLQVHAAPRVGYERVAKLALKLLVRVLELGLVSTELGELSTLSWQRKREHLVSLFSMP